VLLQEAAGASTYRPGWSHLTLSYTETAVRRDSMRRRPSRLSDDEIEADFSPRQRAGGDGLVIWLYMPGADDRNKTHFLLSTPPSPPIPVRQCQVTTAERGPQEIRGAHQQSWPNRCPAHQNTLALPPNDRECPCPVPRNICKLDRSCIRKLVAKKSRCPCRDASQPKAPMHDDACAIHS